MTDTNHCVFTGRVVRDADENSLRKFEYGSKLQFSIAVTKTKIKQDKTFEDYVSYFDVELWGKKADAVYPFIKKGAFLAVEGELKQERWTDKKDQSNKSKIVISAERVLPVTVAKSAQSGNSGNAPAGNGYPAQKTGEPHNNEGFPEDFPF